MKLMMTALLWTAFVAQTALADPTPAIQYVGAVSIQPSQDAKILADWYRKFGVELKAYEDGGYYGFFQIKIGNQPNQDKGPTFYFAVHPKKADAPEKSSRSVSVVFHVSDYNGYVSMLDKQGLKPESVEFDPEHPDMGHFAHYRDPDGNEMTVWGD